VIGKTIHIVIGVKMEKRDLIANHGESYVKYKEQVPGMIPFLRKKRIKNISAWLKPDNPVMKP
jgi:hypothetical protein